MAEDTTQDTKFTEGLRDAIIGKSRICDVNGDEGKLIYAGYDIHDLAQHTTFEEVVFLLWNIRLPDQTELDSFKAELDSERALPLSVRTLMEQMPESAPPMSLLRTAISLLGCYDPDEGDDSPEANRRKAVRLVAQTGTTVAALARLRSGQDPIAPKPGLSTAASFLYQLTGKEPSELEARAMDVALILHADHEINASTFAARVTIATLTDMYSAVVSAIGALAGPLHGGANVNVMRVLEKIGSADKAEEIVTQMLASGQKIPGIGHAVYKALDPRAISLREMSQQLAEATGDRHWFELSEAVQKAADKALLAKGKTTLKANVDFFSASVYHALGIPTEQFTPVFAVSRMAGWTAHILEQLENNKIMRPRALYIGPRDLKVVPLPSVRKSAALLFLLLSCVAAHAQDKAGDASQPPAVNPGRPTVTDPASLTAPGYLEMEIGGSDQRGGEDTHRQFSVPTVLKLTNKAKRVELRVDLDSFVTQKDDQGEHLSGFGDVTPGLQYLVTKQGPHSYDLAARVEYKIPSAARGIGTGKTDYDLLLLASKDYNSTLHADYNIGMYQLGKASGTGYATQYQISGSLNTKLSPVLTLEDEVYGYSGSSEGGTITSTLHALAYQTSPSIAIDAGVDIGLSQAAPKRTYLLGATFFAGKLF